MVHLLAARVQPAQADAREGTCQVSRPVRTKEAKRHKSWSTPRERRTALVLSDRSFTRCGGPHCPAMLEGTARLGGGGASVHDAPFHVQPNMMQRHWLPKHAHPPWQVSTCAASTWSAAPGSATGCLCATKPAPASEEPAPTGAPAELSGAPASPCTGSPREPTLMVRPPHAIPTAAARAPYPAT